MALLSEMFINFNYNQHGSGYAAVPTYTHDYNLLPPKGGVIIAQTGLGGVSWDQGSGGMAAIGISPNQDVSGNPEDWHSIAVTSAFTVLVAVAHGWMQGWLVIQIWG